MYVLCFSKCCCRGNIWCKHNCSMQATDSALQEQLHKELQKTFACSRGACGSMLVMRSASIAAQMTNFFGMLQVEAVALSHAPIHCHLHPHNLIHEAAADHAFNS